MGSMENENLHQTQPSKLTESDEPAAESGSLVSLESAMQHNQDDMLDDLDATQPVEAEVDEDHKSELDLPSEALDESFDEQSTGKSPKKKRSPAFVYTLLGILALLIIAALSAFGGYTSGINLRQSAESTQVAQAVSDQFQLGIQELEDGQYYRARQRFEYVIQVDPAYPGAMDKLSEVLLYLNTTATPTLVPTPTLTPTPDMRGVQEMFDQSQQYLLDSDWNNAFETLLALRKADPDFHTVEVDGMLFLALRNRGRDKIINQADLEGGIYDLTLASRFGLLDTEAEGILNWTTLYITGASFWEIDWGQAAYYFSQVAPHVPNLRDGSGLTAAQRYRTSLFNYAKLLAQQKRWCDAAAQLEIALSIASDPELEQAYADVAQRCAAQQEPKPEEGDQPTPSP